MQNNSVYLGKKLFRKESSFYVLEEGHSPEVWLTIFFKSFYEKDTFKYTNQTNVCLAAIDLEIPNVFKFSSVHYSIPCCSLTNGVFDFCRND